MNIYEKHDDHGYTPADIYEMEEDLMCAREALRDIMDFINNPNGFSKYALKSIVETGLGI